MQSLEKCPPGQLHPLWTFNNSDAGYVTPVRKCLSLYWFSCVSGSWVSAFTRMDFSLQHWTLLPSPVTSKTGCCFCFGSISSFFLKLFLHWSPVGYWAPTNPGIQLSALSFCLFILFMGFSRHEYWNGLTFPSPLDWVEDSSRISFVSPLFPSAE